MLLKVNLNNKKNTNIKKIEKICLGIQIPKMNTVSYNVAYLKIKKYVYKCSTNVHKII